MSPRRFSSILYFFSGVLSLLGGLSRGNTTSIAVAILAFGAAYRQYSLWRQEEQDDDESETMT